MFGSKIFSKTVLTKGSTLDRFFFKMLIKSFYDERPLVLLYQPFLVSIKSG